MARGKFKTGRLSEKQQEEKHRRQLIREILIEKQGTDFDRYNRESLTGMTEESLEHLLSSIIKSKPFKYESLPSDIRRVIEF